MPGTRYEIERDEKVEQILAAAEERLREGGYAGLSVAGIARDLELAPNSIYWYFPSKDDLFVAAARRILAGVLQRKPARSRGLERRILWFVEQLDDLEHLRIALYERARHSPPVAGYVEELRAGSLEMLRGALRGTVETDRVDLAAETLLATIEGARLQGLRGRERDRVVGYAVKRLVA